MCITCLEIALRWAQSGKEVQCDASASILTHHAMHQHFLSRGKTSIYESKCLLKDARDTLVLCTVLDHQVEVGELVGMLVLHVVSNIQYMSDGESDHLCCIACVAGGAQVETAMHLCGIPCSFHEEQQQTARDVRAHCALCLAGWVETLVETIERAGMSAKDKLKANLQRRLQEKRQGTLMLRLGLSVA